MLWYFALRTTRSYCARARVKLRPAALCVRLPQLLPAYARTRTHLPPHCCCWRCCGLAQQTYHRAAGEAGVFAGDFCWDPCKRSLAEPRARRAADEHLSSLRCGGLYCCHSSCPLGVLVVGQCAPEHWAASMQACVPQVGQGR